MSNVLVNDASLTAIANAIRDKNGSNARYKPGDMANAITNIPGPALDTKSIIANGTYSAEDENLDGYSAVTVNVPTQGITPTGTKQVTVTENGTKTEDVTNYASVEILTSVTGGGISIDDLATKAAPSGSIVITANSIAAHAFRNFENLTDVSAQNATSCGDYAFAGSGLTSGSFPLLETAGSNALNCPLTAISLPALTSCGTLFLGNKHVFTVIDGTMLPLLATCVSGAFNGDTITTSLTLPSWTGLGYTAASGTGHFRGMTKLVTLNLPKCEHIGGNECNGDAKLETVLLSKTSTAAGSKYIRNYAFQNCAKLNKLVLYGSVMWTLDNIGAFSGSPFASGKAGGTLYVPQSMIATYQADTNWATIIGYTNNSIAAIEGSIYE